RARLPRAAAGAGGARRHQPGPLPHPAAPDGRQGGARHRARRHAAAGRPGGRPLGGGHLGGRARHGPRPRSARHGAGRARARRPRRPSPSQLGDPNGMALTTPSNSGHVTFTRTHGGYRPHADAGLPTPGEAAAPQELRLRRRWLVLPAVLLRLLAALAGFALERPAVAPLPPAPVEAVARGRILAADGTVLAEGANEARFYPQGALAAPVLGFTGALQADGRFGLEGLEYRFDGALQTGADVTLTIDPVLQSAAERHLAAAAEQHAAESGAAVVLEAGTGRVLAAASYPSFDPNAWQQAGREQMLNRPFQQVYEPGSVIKPLVVAAALDDGLLAPDETIEAPMTLRVGQKTFRDVAWHEPLLTVPDVLAYSSNSAMIHLGERFEHARLHHWLYRFGVGRDLDLTSAFTRSGILNDWHRWVPQDQAANTIGQNLSLTPLQLAAAYAVFANDGLYVPPVLVEGEEVPPPHRVLSPE